MKETFLGAKFEVSANNSKNKPDNMSWSAVLHTLFFKNSER